MGCCCCPHARSASRLFSFFAGRHRRRFEKRGFEASQQQLIEGLEGVGFDDASLLEIGSGVGHLHQTLLERGARTAVGIELAPKMLDEARRWSSERNLAERTRYVEGDFVTMAGQLEAADVTILDKVVCCYPDADRLIHESLGKTRRVYALTYPRSRWFTKLAMGASSLALWVMRSDFRAYVHDPQRIHGWITSAGFRRRHLSRTFFWQTEVYGKA